MILCHVECVSGAQTDDDVNLCRTTTELTTTLSMWIARLVGLEKAEGIVEVGVRGVSSLHFKNQAM